MYSIIQSNLFYSHTPEIYMNQCRLYKGLPDGWHYYRRGLYMDQSEQINPGVNIGGCVLSRPEQAASKASIYVPGETLAFVMDWVYGGACDARETPGH